MSKLFPKDFINLAQTCYKLKKKCHETKQKPFVEISRININKEGIFAGNTRLYPWENVTECCWPVLVRLVVIEVNGFENLLPMLKKHLLGIRHVGFNATVSDCECVKRFLEEMNVRIVTPIYSPIFPYSEVLNKSIMVRFISMYTLMDSEFLAMDCSLASQKGMVSAEAILSKIKTWMTDPFAGSVLNLVFEYEKGKEIEKIPEILGAVECEAIEPIEYCGDDLFDKWRRDEFICDRKFYRIELDKGYRLIFILRFFNSWRLGFVCIVEGPESKQ